jgi:hypothetical protein
VWQEYRVSADAGNFICSQKAHGSSASN